MKYLLLFLLIFLTFNSNPQSILTKNSNQCETYTTKYKNFYMTDCYYNKWIFSLSTDYIPKKYDSFYLYKRHLIFKTHINNFPIGYHIKNKCPFCIKNKYLYNIKELSEWSFLPETYIKKCIFNNHTIFRVGISGNYWSFNDPECKCEKCL